MDAIWQRLEKPCDALIKHGEWWLHQGKETIDTEPVGKADLEGSSLSDWKKVSNRALPRSDLSLVLLNPFLWHMGSAYCIDSWHRLTDVLGSQWEYQTPWRNCRQGRGCNSRGQGDGEEELLKCLSTLFSYHAVLWSHATDCFRIFLLPFTSHTFTLLNQLFMKKISWVKTQVNETSQMLNMKLFHFLQVFLHSQRVSSKLPPLARRNTLYRGYCFLWETTIEHWLTILLNIVRTNPVGNTFDTFKGGKKISSALPVG